MPMTSEAQRQLSSTIRRLRASLLSELSAATEACYRLAVRAQDAGLDEAPRARRARLERWQAEQERAQTRPGKARRTLADFRREVEQQAAYTWLNRLVLLRILEATGLRPLHVVSGGWESRAYLDFRALAGALRGDPSEGYRLLLGLVFEELTVELPGLFGPAGVAELVPMPGATLRKLIDALNDPALDSCWTDDMCLGWVYQYWNDPEREALDAKLHAGGKVEPHELASKTQMFTERYMVDWLLQNSLGPLWLAMCRKHGWTPEVERDGTLARLEERRQRWRARREAGEVAATALMPLHSQAERHWAYYLPQPLPQGAIDGAPDSVRDIRLLDPAVGSGHFLLVAFELLYALYREEARQRGLEGAQPWSPAACVERILEHNLHGIDLDPRAVQIAAAALWLKARQTSADARPRALQLVASQLRLASLQPDDPALLELYRQVERETGIPGSLTERVVQALAGADHLGSLLQIDGAVAQAIEAHEGALGPLDAQLQLAFMAGPARRQLRPEQARLSLIERLEAFLQRHSGADDLGLQLRGQQLAAGVRFVRMLRPDSIDLVVGNPPYQGSSKLAQAGYVKKHYPRGKADLYAAFLERGLQLVRPGGVAALLTMRNWMFIKQYAALRQWLLESFDLRALGDFAIGAFDAVPNDVLSVVVSIFRRGKPTSVASVALQPTPPDDRSYDRQRTTRKRAAVLCQEGQYEFMPAALRVVPEWPLVYYWSQEKIHDYRNAKLVGGTCPARFGLTTGDNSRFVRRAWEVLHIATTQGDHSWSAFVLGAKGIRWIEPLQNALRWTGNGIEVKTKCESQYGSVSKQIRNEDYYFRRGIAFSAIGVDFGARVYRFPSVFSNTGLSLYPEDIDATLCSLNRSASRETINEIAPGLKYEVGDVNRLPLKADSQAHQIVRRIDLAFSSEESHREPSVEFRHPGPSPWRHAQDWAQTAVDRPAGAPLPPYEPEYDPEPASDHLSFALGVALGRFGPDGKGILDPQSADLSHALPAGILFLDGSLPRGDRRDSLGAPASQRLHQAWREHGPAIDPKSDLRSWLRLKFFSDVHRSMYENRPIHWPLSSAKKTFVAWLHIHRWNEKTLPILLADHLQPAVTRLEGALEDLRQTRAGPDKQAAGKAEKRFAKLQRYGAELQSFIAEVEQCASQGPPPTSPAPKKCPPREAAARYAPDLDDGVMVNSAALWPLLQPQWKDPKKWWSELARAQGRKDYDWSHLAMRYWPTRVDAKCQRDPSLGVAHGCFWHYHPARAWAWELRLQDEIGSEFRISEPPYQKDGGDRERRAAYLRGQPAEALQAVEKEALRRRGRGKHVAPLPELRLLEAGLWSAIPGACYELELRISEKQGQPFLLHAPDEAAARAAFEAAQPDKLRARRQLLARLAGLAGLRGQP